MATYNYDPNQPIYGQTPSYTTENLTEASADLGTMQGAESYIDPSKATVAGQTATLLSSGSPLMQSAQADSMKTANSRGLMNSSMAATAGTKAAIDSVLPIAEQDASTYAEFGLNNQDTYNTSLLNNQTAQLAQQENVDTATLKAQLDAWDNEIAKDYEKYTFQFEKELAQMNIDSANKQAAAAMLTSQTNTVMSNIGSLLNNTDIEMSDDVSSWMSDYMYSSWEGVSDLFNLNISVV